MEKILIFLILIGLCFCLGFSPFAQAEEELSTTVTASSYYGSYLPDRTIDNNLGTFWRGARYARPWWLRYDLQGEYNLDNVTIWWHTFAGSNNYAIQVSDDANTWTTVLSNLSSRVGSGNPCKLIHNLGGRTAQYLRIYIEREIMLFPIIYEVKIYGSPTTPNQSPTAIIDSITPNPAEVGETVSFTGHGTDADGTISAYNWRSNIDGQLSTNSSFDTSTLSANTHTIYFKVQDNDGAWSNEVSQGLTITTPANQAPTATIDSISPNPAEEGDIVVFRGHGTDSDGTITAYNWRSNIDGQLGTNSSIDIDTLSANTHTIYFKVQDNDAAWSNEASQILTITSPNQSPIATIDFISPNPAEQGEVVSFAGHGTDTDGTITAYSWRSNIDGPLSANSSFNSSTLSANAHIIYFKVQDDDAAWSDEVSQTLTIATPNQSPTAIIDLINPNPAEVGEVVTFTGHGTDTDGWIDSYLWDFGDGSSSEQQNSTHTYANANTYNVNLVVTDDDGAVGYDNLNVNVESPNQAPTATIDSISPNPAEQGAIVTFTGHGTDSDGTISAYSWRSDIDGQLSTNSSFNSSSLSANTHTIYFKVQDDDAAWSNETSQTLTITTPNQAPTAIIDLINPNPAEQGEVVSFTGHGTDTDGWIDSYFWDFGDGYNSTQQDATHIYESAGNYTVQFTVTDNEGAVGYDQLLMMVTAPVTPTWQVPQLLRFQGRLTDPEGLPLDGSYDMTFSIYDAEVEGTLLWSETYSQQTQIEVNKGVFSVLLGSITPLELSFDQDYWLSTEVGEDGEMSPRQRISSVGYACRAETVNKGPISHTGQGEVKIGTTETLYFHLEARPKSIILYLWGEASTQGSYPDNLNIVINGLDISQSLLAQANLNWGTQQTTLGDGTSSHPLVIGASGVTGTGALDLSSLDSFFPGEQKLEFTQTGPGSGKVRYNLYIKY